MSKKGGAETMLDAELGGEDYDEKILKKRQRQIAVKICIDLLLFICFLLAFTIVVLSAHNANSALMVSRVKDLIRATTSETPLSDADTDIPAFYDYLENSFLEGYFRNTTERTMAVRLSDSMLPLDITNRAFGTVRIRQLRVAPVESCQNSYMFSEFTTTCYPAYDDSSATKASFGPPNQMEKFRYQEDDDGNVGAEDGRHATYTPGGYYMPITTNKTKTMAGFRDYRHSGFFDPGTRAVFTDFNVWNSNMDLYAVSRVLAEFPPVGQLDISVRVLVLSPRLLEPFASSSTSETIANVLEVVVIIFVLWYVAEELSEISLERWKYFADGWNILDWINLGLILTSMTYRLTAYMDASVYLPMGGAEMAGDSTGENAYTNLQGIATKVETARLINSLNAVLLWLKCIKYIAFFPYVQFLFYTVQEAFAPFVVFFMMFCIIAIAFTLAFVAVFAGIIGDFRTLDKGFLFLLRSVVADIDVMPIYEESPQYGAFLIMLFLVIVIFVSLNVFFAIMAATLMEEAYSKDREVDPKQQAIVVVLGMMVDKCARVIRLEKRIKALSPSLHKRIYGDKKKKEEEERKKQREMDARNAALGKTMSDMDTMGSSTWGGAGGSSLTGTGTAMGGGREKTIKHYTPRQVMQATENMAGRLLSKIHASGIELRIETLRVQESMNQMVAIAKALSIRLDKIRASQDKFLQDFQEG